MSDRRFLPLGPLALSLVSLFSVPAAAQGTSKIQHVLPISIGGMHSLDFANCVKGVPIYGNQTYCPHLSTLSSTGVHYPQALTPKPSDSFPGLVAQITGGTPPPHGGHLLRCPHVAVYFGVFLFASCSRKYASTSIRPSCRAQSAGVLRQSTSFKSNLAPRSTSMRVSSTNPLAAA